MILPICSGYPGNQWCHKTPALLIIFGTFKLFATVGRCVVVLFISSDILPKVKMNVTSADISLTLCEFVWMQAQIPLNDKAPAEYYLERMNYTGLPTLLPWIILQVLEI